VKCKQAKVSDVGLRVLLSCDSIHFPRYRTTNTGAIIYLSPIASRTGSHILPILLHSRSHFHSRLITYELARVSN
jgi:hypothetical protein